MNSGEFHRVVRLPSPLLTTGIGSLPHTQLEMAMQQALAVDIPFLPSMPMKDPAELMIPQVAERLPGMRYDKEGNVTINVAAWQKDAVAFGQELERALETKKLEAFEPSAEASHAWKPFLWEVENRRLAFAKAQLTGPITAQWVLKLEDGRPVSALPELERQVFRLVLARALAMVRAIRERGATPIFFFDEPGLYAFDKRDALHHVRLQELRIATLALQKEGALVGLHCCSNTEWERLLGLGLNILSMDARLSLGAVMANAGAFQKFVNEGGVLALGIVPTNIAANYDLQGLVEAALATLKANSPAQTVVAHVLTQSLLTPACGLALRSVVDCEEVFDDLKQAQTLLKAALKSQRV